MTRAQRRHHLAIWLVLGPTLLAGLLLAVARRPPSPIESRSVARDGEHASSSVSPAGGRGANR